MSILSFDIDQDKKKAFRSMGIVLVLLLIFPFVAQNFGNSWVRIIDMALLYIMLALGLNIVVGFAGLLDLGYVAFFAIGAHVAAYFGSAFWAKVNDGKGLSLLVGAPTNHLAGIHLNFLIIAILAAAAAALAGVIIGVPTLRLRGDYVGVMT